VASVARYGGSVVPEDIEVGGGEPELHGEPEAYDEFAYLHENAAEFGLPWHGPPAVRRQPVDVGGGRRLSALVWGDGPARLVLLHGGAQNAHTWDTVALALGVPLVAIDLPGHGHADDRRPDGPLLDGMAADVEAAVRALAPDAEAIVGMSLGGLTALALAARAPALVRRLVLVDITPGVTPQKAAGIVAFVRGPDSFASFDDILAHTVAHNPGRSLASLRRGVLHNAVRRPDGRWVWRHARGGPPGPVPAAQGSTAGPPGTAPASVLEGPAGEVAGLWDVLESLTVPVLLVRGTRPQSVVDDADVAELRRRQPTATVVAVDAGHSVQGDAPVALAQLIAAFLQPG